MRHHFALFGISLLFWISAPNASFAQTFVTEEGHVEFRSTVPLHSFTGSSDYLVGVISIPDSTVDFYLDLATLETGIRKRDNDMRRTLDVEAHPFAEFYGKLVSEIDLADSLSQPARVRGEFTIHGVTRTIEVSGSLRPGEEGLRLTASWILNLEEYDIEPPGILFYRVDEELNISLNALLTPTESPNPQ